MFIWSADLLKATVEKILPGRDKFRESREIYSVSISAKVRCFVQVFWAKTTFSLSEKKMTII